MAIAAAASVERWRALDPLEKAALASGASVALQELSLAALAARLPEASPRELELRTLALRHGKDLRAARDRH